MWLELRDGTRAMVLLNTLNKGNIASGKYRWFPLDTITNDLCDINEDEEFDVVKVYIPRNNQAYYNFSFEDAYVAWERKEPKKMTVAEVEAALGYPVEIISGEGET